MEQQKYRIRIGDITSDNILKGHDLIVNPTNPEMVCGAGVSGAIFAKAGVEELEKYTQDTFDIHYLKDNFNKKNVMKVGDMRLTPGFNLGMDILFVQGPKKWEFNEERQCYEAEIWKVDLLMEVYEKMFNFIAEKGYKNVLLPSLGTGTYGFKHEEVGQRLYELISKFVKNHDICIDLVLQKYSDKHYYLPKIVLKK